MFKPTDRQLPLWDAATQLPDGVRRRLEGSWAQRFQQEVLPLLFEAEPLFAQLYCEDNGRPNWSVARQRTSHRHRA